MLCAVYWIPVEHDVVAVCNEAHRRRLDEVASDFPGGNWGRGGVSVSSVERASEVVSHDADLDLVAVGRGIRPVVGDEASFADTGDVVIVLRPVDLVLNGGVEWVTRSGAFDDDTLFEPVSSVELTNMLEYGGEGGVVRFVKGVEVEMLGKDLLAAVEAEQIVEGPSDLLFDLVAPNEFESGLPCRDVILEQLNVPVGADHHLDVDEQNLGVLVLTITISVGAGVAGCPMKAGRKLDDDAECSLDNADSEQVANDRQISRCAESKFCPRRHGDVQRGLHSRLMVDHVESEVRRVFTLALVVARGLFAIAVDLDQIVAIDRVVLGDGRFEANLRLSFEFDAEDEFEVCAQFDIDAGDDRNGYLPEPSEADGVEANQRIILVANTDRRGRRK